MSDAKGVNVGKTDDGMIFIVINTVYENKYLQTLAQMAPKEALELADILVQTVNEITGWGGKNVGNSPNPN